MTTEAVEQTWDNKPIPLELWGRDHWSTFRYIETRIVSYKGCPAMQQMRCFSGRALRPGADHGGHSHIPAFMKDYPTRLVVRDANDSTKVAGRINLNGHDDWDCADDAVSAKLLVSHGTGLHPVFALTDYGWEVIKAITEADGAFMTVKMPDRALFDEDGMAATVKAKKPKRANASRLKPKAQVALP